jgi:hypothetical protein
MSDHVLGCAMPRKSTPVLACLYDASDVLPGHRSKRHILEIDVAKASEATYAALHTQQAHLRTHHRSTPDMGSNRSLSAATTAEDLAGENRGRADTSGPDLDQAGAVGLGRSEPDDRSEQAMAPGRGDGGHGGLVPWFSEGCLGAAGGRPVGWVAGTLAALAGAVAGVGRRRSVGQCRSRQGQEGGDEGDRGAAAPQGAAGRISPLWALPKIPTVASRHGACGPSSLWHSRPRALSERRGDQAPRRWATVRRATGSARR